MHLLAWVVINTDQPHHVVLDLTNILLNEPIIFLALRKETSVCPSRRPCILHLFDVWHRQASKADLITRSLRDIIDMQRISGIFQTLCLNTRRNNHVRMWANKPELPRRLLSHRSEYLRQPTLRLLGHSVKISADAAFLLLRGL